MRGLNDCVDVLDPAVRGGQWYWRSGATVSCYEALAQEHRAWAHLGAAQRDQTQELCKAEQALASLEATHGGPDPRQWQWGEGLACHDVFQADDAAREHARLKAQIKALRSYQGQTAQRAASRSRSPRVERA